MAEGDKQVTAITTFTLTGDRGEFESAVTDQAELLSGAAGFLRGQVLRSLRRPDTYVNLAQWQDGATRLAAVQSTPFYITYAILEELSEADSDQTVRVLGAGDPQPAGYEDLAGRGATVLTRFDLTEGADSQEFERRFEAHARFMREQDGFIAHALVRSERHAGRYVNVGWWRDPGAYLTVMGTEEFQADARAMAELVTVDGDMFQVVTNLISDAALSAAAV
jgi:heme-degrading monooxygenase HmoA